MPFPDPHKTIDLLGMRMKDRITGLEGVVTSVCFDLYGCCQAALHTGLDKDGKVADQHWFDVQRLDGSKYERVMARPEIGNGHPRTYDHGPSEKPKPRAV